MKLFELHRKFGRITITLFSIPRIFDGVKICFRDIKFARKNTFIPLGTNCYARVMLTKYGLKPRKIHGELSFPFDLVFMPINIVSHFCITDFIDFFENIEYSSEDSIFVNKKYNISFIHDYFKHDEKFLFQARYIRRINNLKKMLCKGHKIFITVIFGDELDEDSINNIYYYLNYNIGAGNFIYCVFQITNPNNDFNNQTINHLSSGIKFISIPAPVNNYFEIWHLKEYRKQAEIIAFEQKFVKLIEGLLNP